VVHGAGIHGVLVVQWTTDRKRDHKTVFAAIRSMTRIHRFAVSI
jgi:hypothetical protein